MKILSVTILLVISPSLAFSLEETSASRPDGCPAEKARTKESEKEKFWQARSWTNGEIILAHAWILENVLDGVQTYGGWRLGYTEMNPLFRNDDGSPNMTKVVWGKTLFLGATLSIAHFIPHSERKIVLVVLNVIQGAALIWNEYQLAPAGGVFLRF